MKKLIAYAVMFLLIISLISGCGCVGDKASGTKPKTSSSAKTEETLKVIETTPDGGTVEQDKAGNKIKKNKNGKITSIVDKNGNSVNINNYITNHPGVNKKPVVSDGSTSSKALKSKAVSSKTEKSSKVKKNSKSRNSSTAEKTSKKKTSSVDTKKSEKSSKKSKKSSGKTNSSTKSNSSKKNKSESVEEEIPTVIATVPEDDSKLETIVID